MVGGRVFYQHNFVQRHKSESDQKTLIIHERGNWVMSIVPYINFLLFFSYQFGMGAKKLYFSHKMLGWPPLHAWLG